jgi:hypothetical protein
MRRTGVVLQFVKVKENVHLTKMNADRTSYEDTIPAPTCVTLFFVSIVMPGVTMGCYQDSPKARDLHQDSMQSKNLTLTSCANYCLSKVRFFLFFKHTYT